MSYKFNLSDIDGLLNSQEHKANSILFPHNYGSMNIQEERIHDDISLFKGDTHASADISMSTEFSINSLSISITLQDDMIYNDLLSKKETKHTANNTLIEYINEESGVYDIQKDTHRKAISVVIKDDFLQKHFFANLKDEDRMIIEKNYNENITTNLKSALSSAKTLFLANEIYNSPFTGTLNSLYLQTKVYEIIYNEFSSIITDKKTMPEFNRVKFSKADIDSLHHAKEILMTSKEHFSIAQIARKVAINENKLKHGFKYLFNTTPGTIMLERKMYEAKELLKSSDYNVTEIANIVGYKYVQNFTFAFKRFFGESPRELMKGRKYY